jgi:hypothetical protein
VAGSDDLSTSQTSVNFHHTTGLNNPEDIVLHTRRRENFRSHRSILTVPAMNLGCAQVLIQAVCLVAVRIGN